MTPNWVVHFYSSSCSSESLYSSERPNLEVNSQLSTRLYQNFCRPFILIFSSSFLTVTSAFLFSLSSLFQLFLRLYLSLSQYDFSFSMASFRFVQISGFLTLGWPWMMKRHNLSYSQWIRSITLKNSALLDQIERSLNAFQYSFRAVLKSLSSVQMMPIISLIQATLLESQPYCSSLNFNAFSKISKALGSSPCNLYKIPMLQQQSPANCPLMFADFLKHSIAFLKQPSYAQQQPIRKQQFDAQNESAPKKIMIILVQITQQLMHSIPIAQQRLPMQEIRFNFFCRYSQYFSLTDYFCLSVGTSFKSSINSDFYLRQFSSSCFALFLSLSSRQVFVSRQTVPPQSSSQLADGLEKSLLRSKPTSTLASSRHSENCLWLKFSQQLFLTQNIFFWRSSVGALLT